jgi:hypothetical protein
MIVIDCLDAHDVPAEVIAMCDVAIMDPPYSSHVHKSATSQSKVRGTRKRDLGFDHLSPRDRRLIARVAATIPRWSVIYSDVESSTWLRIAGQAAGAAYIRTVPWVRWSMPQLSGDRPPQGFEHLVIFHGKRDGNKKRWNGPGNAVGLNHNCLRGETKHKAEKPLDQILDLVSWFSEPGECVLDLFAGSGTTAQACRLLGRQCYSVERDPYWSAHAQYRVSNPLGPSDRERVERWLADTQYDTDALTDGGIIRAAARLEDRDRVRAFIK